VMMDHSMLLTDRTYLCFGVGWRTGVPCLDVADITSTEVAHIPLADRFLGFRAASSHRYCTGRYTFSQGTDTELVPCPDSAVAAKGGQCAACAARDEFRFVHHYHTGGHSSAALVRYMSQQHWVYIATFADGSSKVGTAADLRKKSRLDEQGAVIASYIARAADGKLARYVEDSVTSVGGVAQAKSRTAKLGALARPLSLQRVEGEHRAVLDGVAPLVDGYAQNSRGLAALRESWQPAPGIKAIVADPPTGGWPIYTHDISVGEHGLYIEACCGQTALVHTEVDDNPLRYLVDLGKLKGMRLTVGEFSSPGSAVQSALF
jgi:hypothetical protein